MEWSDDEYKEFLRQFEPRDVRPLPQAPEPQHRFPYFKWFALAAASAAAILVALPYLRTKPAVLVEDAAGTRKIALGEVLQTHESGAMVVLTDGSQVEIRSQSELLVDKVTDGANITLRKGSIIVTAANQHGGHLYVRTKDVFVSVVGTVFLVDADQQGSRVAVLQGNVRVRQGDSTRDLRTGDQFASSPSAESIPITEELSWSRNAEAHRSLLSRSSVPFPAVASKADTGASPIVEKPLVKGTGEAQSRPLEFEAASIKPSHPQENFGVIFSLNGTVTARAATLRDFIAAAYKGVPIEHVIAGADWINTDTYSLQAKAPDGAMIPADLHSYDRLKAMLQALLADRFGLRVHREQRTFAVYELTAAKNGPKFQEAHRDCSSPITSRPASVDPNLCHAVSDAGPTHGMRGQSIDMYDLAWFLSGKLDRPVIDKTGIVGLFDMKLAPWNPYLDGVPPSKASGPVDFNSLPTLFVAVEEQLGLKLSSSTAPMEVIVVDEAHKVSPKQHPGFGRE